jgi:hypothetical protein
VEGRAIDEYDWLSYFCSSHGREALALQPVRGQATRCGPLHPSMWESCGCGTGFFYDAMVPSCRIQMGWPTFMLGSAATSHAYSTRCICGHNTETVDDDGSRLLKYGILRGAWI